MTFEDAMELGMDYMSEFFPKGGKAVKQDFLKAFLSELVDQEALVLEDDDESEEPDFLDELESSRRGRGRR